MLERIVKLTFHPQHTDRFIAIFDEMQPQILEMNGCHSVRLLRDAEMPNIFFTHSIWDDTATLDAYRASTLFRTTWSEVKTLFCESPAAWSVTVERNCLRK